MPPADLPSRAPFEAAMGLMRALLQEQRRHRAAEPDMHLVDLTLGLGDDLDLEKGHPLVKHGEVFLVA